MWSNAVRCHSSRNVIVLPGCLRLSAFTANLFLLLFYCCFSLDFYFIFFSIAFCGGKTDVARRWIILLKWNCMIWYDTAAEYNSIMINVKANDCGSPSHAYLPIYIQSHRIFVNVLYAQRLKSATSKRWEIDNCQISFKYSSEYEEKKQYSCEICAMQMSSASRTRTAWQEKKEERTHRGTNKNGLFHHKLMRLWIYWSEWQHTSKTMAQPSVLFSLFLKFIQSFA